MLNDTSSLLSHLATRRSGKPRDMIAPGPDDTELQAILTIAARTPDHGKLTPWRFVHVPADRRGDFQALLDAAWRAEKGEPSPGDREAIHRLAYQAPCLVVLVSAPVVPHKIPEWEQFLSAGAAAMNLLHAAHAHGFAASWITGWASESRAVNAALAGPGARIAGFVFIGTPATPLEDRPRPEFDRIASEWDGRPRTT